jgi:prepilin-type N-terminal cleavage/methylation domain-containing protein
MRFTSTLRNQKGFSLLELLLVVAVGAILLLAGLAVYRNVTDNSKVTESIRLLNVTKQETQRLFQGEGNYPAQQLNEVLIDAKAFPSSYINGSQVRTPYNGDVTVTGAGRTFTITFADVPESSCIKIGGTFAADDADFVQLRVRGTALDAGADGVYGALELQNACNGDSEMIWEFY